MYKLTLCLKYLFRRGLAYFATIAVVLCTFIVLLVVSVLDGFVVKIERAAKGLFGDVVISTPSLSGMAYYDDFIARLKKEVPEVEGASPFILTYGILQIPGDPDFRRPVQVTGIRLPERASVSDFEEGLFIQKNWPNPTFDPPTPVILERLRAELDKLLAIGRRMDEQGSRAPLGADVATLRQRLSIAEGWQQTAIDNIRLAGKNRQEIETLRKELDKAEQEGNEPRRKVLEEDLAHRQRQAIHGPEDRVILGLGIPGLSFRTPKGETVRILGPGHNIGLSLIPFGRDLKATGMTPVTRQFTVIDDCATDVSSIDSEVVYIPFEALQRLNNMDEQVAAGDANRVVEAARCSQIHIKVAPEWGRGEKLKEINGRIERVFRAFEQQYAARGLVVARSHVYVDTWRDRQIRLVQQIESQRTLMVMITGWLSLVAVILILVVFYVIVVQKTRDIGVLKAVGASGQGVAAIFLSYGGAIGLVGSVLGVLAACMFVWNINPIHDWVARVFGFEVWSRETFMFEKIPNDVSFLTALRVVITAILAGVIGAILPAILAAVRQPVRALRYE